MGQGSDSVPGNDGAGWADWEAEQQEMDAFYDGFEENVKQMAKRYVSNKMVPVGSPMSCACCDTPMIKRSYQSQYCSNKGQANCKDRFWNMIDPKRFSMALLQIETPFDHPLWDLAERLTKPNLKVPTRSKVDVQRELLDAKERVLKLERELLNM